jgi:hypothetical protein
LGVVGGAAQLYVTLTVEAARFASRILIRKIESVRAGHKNQRQLREGRPAPEDAGASSVSNSLRNKDDRTNRKGIVLENAFGRSDDE